MSIIFQTLKKLNNQSAGIIQKQVGLKQNLRTNYLSGKKLRNAAAALSLFLVFVMSVFLFYLSSDSKNVLSSKDNNSVSYATANASIVPSAPENKIQAVFLSDENVKKQQADPSIFVFTPPDSSEDLKLPYSFSARKTESQTVAPAQNKKTGEPGFTPAKRIRESSVITEQQIVKKIQISFIEGDMKNAENLLEQLAAIKGEDSIYVMKLRAFFCLHTGKNRSAVSLLKKVLARNADDAEAGINMAILEIRLKEYSQAKLRLTRLKSIYPANTIISNMLSKLD
jgi:tetratricopeptide (TPR) repeat protein